MREEVFAFIAFSVFGYLCSWLVTRIYRCILRDRLAGMAMVELIRDGLSERIDANELAESSYNAADAMMIHRRKVTP